LPDCRRATKDAGRKIMSGPDQDKRNALLQAVFQLRSKARTRTQPFSCFLDELPNEWASSRARSEPNPAVDDAELIVNSSFWYQQDNDPREKLQHRAPSLDGFLRGYPIAWVQNPGTEIWTPYWVRGEWAETLRSLRAGTPAPPTLPPEVRLTLALADILVTRGHEQEVKARWDRICEAAQGELRTRGYAIVRSLIQPQQLGAMRRYYRALVADGGLPLGDDQSPERYRLHSEVLAAFLHPQLTSLVSRIAGEETKPSYVYFASYRSGASLPRHTDRAQCEFSISLLADYVPEPDGPCGWPLYLEDPRMPDEVHAADLGIGDCIVYRGRELVHYRNPLPDGHQSTSVFLHYVRAGFSGRLW